MELKSVEWAMGLIVTATTIVLTMLYRKITSLNERVDRVKDDYVRRDDFADHEKRIEKRFDKIDAKLDRLIARK